MKQSGFVLLRSIRVCALHWLIPDFGHPLIHILVQGSIVTLLFLGPILWFQLAPDLNERAEGIWLQIRKQLFTAD